MIQFNINILFAHGQMISSLENDYTFQFDSYMGPNRYYHSGTEWT